MTNGEIALVLGRCRFEHHPDLYIRWSLLDESDLWLQIVDSSLPYDFNSGRKWRLSRHMCRSEIVGTAFAAYMAWVEHEARESFTYRGESIYGPHYDVDALWLLAQNLTAHEYRSAG